MGVGKRKDFDVEILLSAKRAIELTEEALAQVSRMGVEAIHCGLEAGAHVEAAERDMRNALRQLVLSERELQARIELPRRGEAAEAIADVLPGPGLDGRR